MTGMPRVYREGNVRVGRDGHLVVLATPHGCAMVLPADKAMQMGRALIQKALEIEEEQQADRIAIDAAILMRAGAPIGLTDNRHIKRQAGIEVAHNTQIRKSALGMKGIESKEVLGTPTVVREETMAQRIARMSPREKEQWMRVLEASNGS